MCCIPIFLILLHRERYSCMAIRISDLRHLGHCTKGTPPLGCCMFFPIINCSAEFFSHLWSCFCPIPLFIPLILFPSYPRGAGWLPIIQDLWNKRDFVVKFVISQIDCCIFWILLLRRSTDTLLSTFQGRHKQKEIKLNAVNCWWFCFLLRQTCSNWGWEEMPNLLSANAWVVDYFPLDVHA